MSTFILSTLIKMQVIIGVDLWHFENESAEKVLGGVSLY